MINVAGESDEEEEKPKGSHFFPFGRGLILYEFQER
jgi:hypothetical protein